MYYVYYNTIYSGDEGLTCITDNHTSSPGLLVLYVFFINVIEFHNSSTKTNRIPIEKVNGVILGYKVCER